jgi:hypothetical protein
MATFLFCATPVMAEDSTAGSDWTYGASIYMWGPSMNIDTPTPPGLTVELPFYQILNDLKMTLMGEVSMRNDKWFLPMSIDVGGGNSDGTWQGIAGIGYNFTKFNTSLAYRYLSFEFDDVPAMSKLVVKGPMLNIHFSF